ncbi:MAG: DUF4364 family protein [Clostridia bacterium]|nr:DUF4364 family protein [Clostridia bacterium]
MFTDKNEIKAVTLSVASSLSKSVSPDLLISSVLASGLVNLTDLTDCFLELCENGLIEIAEIDGAKTCSITQKGISILPELSVFITPAVSDQIKRSALRYYDSVTSGTKYYSRIERTENGYLFVAGCTKNDEKTFEAKLAFADEKDAISAKKNFELRPQSAVNAAIASITGEVDLLF